MNKTSKKTSKVGNYFFILLLILFSILAILMFLPFLTPLVLALVLAVIFAPLNHWISRKFFHNKERSNLSALITMVLIFIVVIVPLILIVNKIYLEVENMYQYLTEDSGQIYLMSLLDRFKPFLSKYLPNQIFSSINISNLFSEILKWLIANIVAVFSNVFQFGIKMFVLILALFYFLRDGREIKRQIIALSPLLEKEDKSLISSVDKSVYSIFVGTIAVAIIQGALTGIGLAIFGVPGAVLWGSVAALAALIPAIGTALVLAPAIIYLFLKGTTFMAIGLIIWGVAIVGLADNFLRPILMAPSMKIHAFLVLLSVLGGLLVFGPIGFLLGPMVLAFLAALLNIYKNSKNLGKE